MNLLFYSLIRLIKHTQFQHLLHVYRPSMFQTAYDILGNESEATTALYKAFPNIFPYLDLLPKHPTDKTKGFFLLVTKYAALSMQTHTIESNATEIANMTSAASTMPSLVNSAQTALETPLSLSTGASLSTETSLSAEASLSMETSLPADPSSLLQTISHLEPLAQDLLSLLYFYGLKLEDAARLLNLTPQTALSILQSAIDSCKHSN